MALLNGMYLHVVQESLTRQVDATSHPVESGLPLADTVRPRAANLSLSGKIVDYGDMTAAQIIATLEAWQRTGALIEYRGRSTISPLQIRSLDTDQTSTVAGGADFSLELVEVRIAQSSYVPSATVSTPSVSEVTPAAIVKGARVVFKGGGVYSNSAAGKPRYTRGRSTCEVTDVRNGRAHPYHLISTDGKGVYGWVNASDVEGTAITGTAGVTNIGTQQVKSDGDSEVWHTVKAGDNVYRLVRTQYSYLGTSEAWVLANNPDAFSTPGDCRTLQIGARLLMGYK